MYGKHFESMYTGSMMGQGALAFAVWGYVISHVKDDTIELNPRLLAALIGEGEHNIKATLAAFCRPDPHSRTKDEDGRKLIKIGEFAYRVVNAKKYRSMRNEEDRREYMKDYMRKRRKNADSVNTGKQCKQCKPQLAHTEAEAEADTDKKKVPKKKILFLDCIKLTEDERDKLKQQFGQIQTMARIQNLNDYLMSTGKRYKSHYHTILNWSRRDAEKKGPSTDDVVGKEIARMKAAGEIE